MKKSEFHRTGFGFWHLTQSSLKRRFVSKRQKAHFLVPGHAQRTENAAFFVHRRSLDPLRRHGADPAILPPPSIAPPLAKVCAHSPPCGRLSPQRSDSGPA